MMSAMDHLHFESVGVEDLGNIAQAMEAEDLAGLGDSAASGMIDSLGDALEDLDSDKLVGLAESIEADTAATLDTEQIEKMVSNIDVEAISEIDTDVMGGMMAGLSEEGITNLTVEHQEAVLESTGADLLDTGGLDFSDVTVTETTFADATAGVDETTPVEEAQEVFSSSNLFG